MGGIGPVYAIAWLENLLDDVPPLDMIEKVGHCGKPWILILEAISTYIRLLNFFSAESTEPI
jgi:hypothetical protein